jgi:predicted branched-subunit amino acid permease
MLLFTALFGGLMLLSIESRRRMVAVLLIGCIAILGVSPPPAQAQFCLPCVIQAVLATISQTIGNWLTQCNQRGGFRHPQAV